MPDHLKALCPAYPLCDNALLAAYDKIYQESLAPAGGPQAPEATSAELPCANYPFCDVNHVALAQGLPCANFPNCDVHHVAIAQRAKRQEATPLTPGNIPGLVPGSPAAAQWGCSTYPPRPTCSSRFKETGSYPSDPWKHSWIGSWICSCSSMVGCSTYPPRPTCSSCFKETGSYPSDSWKHPWIGSWICSCSSMVGCSTYPQRPTCSPCFKETGSYPSDSWKHSRIGSWISSCSSMVG